MAGLLRQKGKDVRVVNSSRTPPRYDFLDPDGTLFEHFGTQVEPADLADREVVVILDLSAWSQLGDMAGLVREFPGPRVVIDHHVSQDDLGAIFLKDTSAEATGTLVVRAIQALGGTFTPRGRHRPADGDRDGHRLVPPPQHQARDPPRPRPSWSSRGADRRDLPPPLRAEHPGPAQADGRDPRRPPDRRWTGGSPTPPSPATTSTRTGAIPQDTEDLVDFTVSLARRRGRPAVHRAGAGRGQGLVPVAERPRLCPAGRRRSAAAATARRPGRPCPSRSPRASPACSTAVRQALEPRRFPQRSE